MNLNLFRHLHKINFMVRIIFTTKQKLSWLFKNLAWSNQIISLLNFLLLYFLILIFNLDSRLNEFFLDAVHQIKNQLLSSFKRLSIFFNLWYFFNGNLLSHRSEINRNTLQLTLLILKLNIKFKTFSFAETLLFDWDNLGFAHQIRKLICQVGCNLFCSKLSVHPSNIAVVSLLFFFLLVMFLSMMLFLLPIVMIISSNKSLIL